MSRAIRLQDLRVLRDDLVPLQAGQALQAHLQDRLGLHLGELHARCRSRAVHRAGSSFFRHSGSEKFPAISPSLASAGFLRAADQLDHRIEPVEGDLEAFQDMGAGLGLLQLEDGAAGDDLAAVVDEMADGVAQGQDLRPVVDDGQHDDAEGGLHLGLLVELVEDDLRVLVPLQLDDDAHAVAVRLVAEVGDPFDLLLPHQFGDLLDQVGLVDLVGDLGDDDRLALGLLLGLDEGPGAHLDDAAAGPVGLQQSPRGRR